MVKLFAIQGLIFLLNLITNHEAIQLLTEGSRKGLSKRLLQNALLLRGGHFDHYSGTYENAIDEELHIGTEKYSESYSSFRIPVNAVVKTDGTIKNEESSSSRKIKSIELFGVPRVLLPYFISFLLDSMATGLAMPLLPFYVMDLGASALQLSFIISFNYIIQMIGCIIMGRMSDLYGRRVCLLLCLGASSVSYFFVSRATTLTAFVLARMISASFGGMLPIMQSAVADISNIDDRPKYMGRIMATFGLGFVLGPALSAILSTRVSARDKIRYAAALPLLGFLMSTILLKETRRKVKGYAHLNTDTPTPPHKSSPPIVPKSSHLSREISLLVLNGFLIMYAFGTESIYALFMKDNFGYGEERLSALLAVNGLIMGVFQVFCIKPMITLVGKHATLAIGNSMLALGMIGLAVIRSKVPHFILFSLHILGYSIADTALVSLLTRYSSPSSQGSDLALNQAAQSCARVFSPLLAGLLYEQSSRIQRSFQHSSGYILLDRLPVGALPFLVGGLCPLVAVAIPVLLHIASKDRKSRVTRRYRPVSSDIDRQG
jgi:DHA1 family multidrug resistance protein-like MFS transporter